MPCSELSCSIKIMQIPKNLNPESSHDPKGVSRRALPMTSKPSSWLRSSMSVRWISRSALVPSLNPLP